MSLGEGESQNEAYHYLNLITGAHRVPKYSFKTLTEWYHSPVPAHTFLLFQYLLMRTIANLDLLEKTETITKTASVDFVSLAVVLIY